MTAGRPRREVIAALCPREGLVVDVGADHGHVAHEVGAIATERAPGRMGRGDLRWVVADGLRPFRRVDVAIIAGMGANTIARILGAGPRPERAIVVHAQDDPPRLRVWLAANGWRIEEERLAREAGRFAEVIRAVPGVEEAAGVPLELGPRLVEGDDPLLPEHLAQLAGYYAALIERTEGRAPREHEGFCARAAWVRRCQLARGFPL